MIFVGVPLLMGIKIGLDRGWSALLFALRLFGTCSLGMLWATNTSSLAKVILMEDRIEVRAGLGYILNVYHWEEIKEVGITYGATTGGREPYVYFSNRKLTMQERQRAKSKAFQLLKRKDCPIVIQYGKKELAATREFWKGPMTGMVGSV